MESTTPHFSLIADSNTAPRREVGTCLESMHAFFGLIAPDPCALVATEMQAYVFHQPGSFETWNKGANDTVLDTNSWSVVRPYKVVLSLGASPEGKPCVEANKQFAEVGSRLSLPLTAPHWLRVGIREYAGALVVVGDDLRLGWEVPEHVNTLGANERTSLRALLAQVDETRVEEGSARDAVTTAHSWALVHYLFEMRGETPETIRDLIEDLCRTEPATAVIETHLGIPFGEIEVELRKKIRKRRYEEISWPRPAGRAYGVTSGRSLTKTESALRGAEMLAQMSPWRYEQTERILDWAESQEEDKAWIASLRGMMWEHRLDAEESIRAYERALTLEPGHTASRKGIGRMLLASSHPEDTKASSYLRTLTEDFPSDADLLLDLSESLQATDPMESARSAIRALHVCPSRERAWAHLRALVEKDRDAVEAAVASSEVSDGNVKAELDAILGH